MNFFTTMLILLGCYAIAYVICFLIIPIITGPFIMFGGEQPIHWSEKQSFRFKFCVLINTIIVFSVYMVYIAFMVNTVKESKSNGFGEYVLWFLVILNVCQPYLKMLGLQGKRQDDEQRALNPNGVDFNGDPLVLCLKYASWMILVGFIMISLSDKIIGNFFYWLPSIS